MPRPPQPGPASQSILIRKVQLIMNRILGRLAAGAAGVTLPAVLAAGAMASTCPPDVGYGPGSVTDRRVPPGAATAMARVAQEEVRAEAPAARAAAQVAKVAAQVAREADPAVKAAAQVAREAARAARAAPAR
jgi:hypothetical protein